MDGVPVHFHGVVEELLFIVDSGYPIPGEHDPVFFVGVGAAGGDGHIPAQNLVVHGRRTLLGHDLAPPVGDIAVLAEEAVSADVHAVAVVPHGAGDATDGVALLQNQHLVGFLRILPVFQQLITGGDAGRAGSDDHNFLHSKYLSFLFVPQPAWGSSAACRKDSQIVGI